MLVLDGKLDYENMPLYSDKIDLLSYILSVVHGDFDKWNQVVGITFLNPIHPLSLDTL